MLLLLLICKLVLKIVYYVLYPFMFYIPDERRKCVPPSSDDLLNISATRLAELIRKQKLSSEDVVKAYIKRIKEVNPIINAVVEERFEDALKEAKSVTDYLRTTSLLENELCKIKPLLGVPITIKESCMLSGMSLTGGTVLRRGIKASSDGDAVARIKMSGAIPLLVSNTPEMCLSLACYNNITGTTKNPHDTTRVSGGSSGGEAALLGAGASVIGIGSDFAGSVRFPAMCCGVFGHKPTARIVPVKGHFPLTSDKKIFDYVTIGPMVRYSEDLNLLMSIMAGKQAVELNLLKKVDLSQIKVYHLQEFPRYAFNPKVTTEIKNAVTRSVEFLSKNSKTTTMDKCPFVDGFTNAFWISASVLGRLDGVPNLLKGEPNENLALEYIKSLLGQSKFTRSYLWVSLLVSTNKLTYKEEYAAMCNDLKRRITLELGDNGVLLLPTFPEPALKHGETFFKMFGLEYLQFFNVLGLPATQIPCGKTPDGLPIGIQVVAAPYQDRLCFAVAEELEKCFGGWLPPNRSTN